MAAEIELLDGDIMFLNMTVMGQVIIAESIGREHISEITVCHPDNVVIHRSVESQDAIVEKIRKDMAE